MFSWRKKERATVAGSRHRRHRRSVPRRQRAEWPTACRSSRRSPNRRGCGHSRRLEGHRGRRGHRRCSKSDVPIWHEPRRRRRGGGSEHRSMLLRGRARSRQPLLIARRSGDAGSRMMRSRISTSGAPRATSWYARDFRYSRFTCASCAPSIIPRCSIPTGVMGRMRAGWWPRSEAGQVGCLDEERAGRRRRTDRT